MITTQTAIHYSSIAIYVLAALLALDTIRYTIKTKRTPILKEIIYIMLVASALMCIVFSTLQIIWASNGDPAYLAEWESISWLLHDWLNGISHMAFALSVRVFLRWDEGGSNMMRYRKITDNNCLLSSTHNCALRVSEGE